MLIVISKIYKPYHCLIHMSI